MGDAEAVARHRAQGKLTVRERVAELADPGSFRETGILAGHATYDGDKLVSFVPPPTVTGFCTLDGRKVVLTAGDPTADGEVHGTDIGYKMGYAQRLALHWHVPYVRLLDDNGGSILEIGRSARTYLADADTADEAVDLLGLVPVVSAIMGPLRGLQSLETCLCHFSVMVKGTGLVSLGNPESRARDAGHGDRQDQTGAWQMATSSGVIDNVAENEKDALSMIRRFLGYLPNSVWEMPPRVESTDDPNRRDEELLSVIPEDKKKLYDPHEILDHVLDQGSFYEIGTYYGPSTIVGLARANGYPVGVMIKNPLCASVAALDAAAGQ